MIHAIKIVNSEHKNVINVQSKGCAQTDDLSGNLKSKPDIDEHQNKRRNAASKEKEHNKLNSTPKAHQERR